MSITADQLVSDALTLSPQARAFVAERLIESLDATPGQKLSAAWVEEVRKRCREMDEGTVTLRDASSVFSRAYDALARVDVLFGPFHSGCCFELCQNPSQ